MIPAFVDPGTATLIVGLPSALLAVVAILATLRRSRRAEQKATEAKQEASTATVTATSAAETASTAHTTAQTAQETVRAAVPSDALISALLEVVRTLQDELKRSEGENKDLRLKLERLWHLLAEQYPDVLAAAGFEPTWPES